MPFSPTTADEPDIALGLSDTQNRGWSITINGVDFTTYVDIETIKIENHLSERVDLCDFTVVDDTGSLFIPDEAEVIITDVNGAKVFGGWMSNPKFSSVATSHVWACEAREYGALLDQRRVNRIYTNVTDLDAITNPNSGLIPLYAPELSTSGVVHVGTIDRMQFPRQTLREALKAIAEYVGADFWVDYDKVLHWQAPGGISSPFNLSDNPDYAASYPMQDWQYQRDTSQLKNRITVQGGQYTSSVFSETFFGDGVTLDFVTEHDKPIPVAATVGGVSKKVGLSALNSYADGFDILVDDVNRTWIFQTAPGSGVQIVLQYTFKAPIQVQVISSASYLQFGRYYDDFINDQGLLSEEAAITRGQAELNEYALAREVADCSTLQPGLRAGMVIGVTESSTKDSDGNPLSNHPMLIQSVVTTGLGGGWFEYKLQLGSYNKDILMEIVGLGQQQIRTSLAVDFLSDFASQSDTVTATDSVSATPHTGGYTYGDGVAKWGFATWG